MSYELFCDGTVIGQVARVENPRGYRNRMFVNLLGTATLPMEGEKHAWEIRGPERSFAFEGRLLSIALDPPRIELLADGDITEKIGGTE